MKKIVNILFLVILIVSQSQLNQVAAFSFLDAVTLETKSEVLEVAIGADVLINNVIESNIYAVFSPEEVADSGMYCAYITGEELLVDNNLSHYGTCFINDPGEFTIMELAEDIPASYQDLKTSNYLVSEKFVLVLTFGQTYSKIINSSGQDMALISDLVAKPSITPTLTPLLTSMSTLAPTETPTPTSALMPDSVVVGEEISVTPNPTLSITPPPEIELVLATDDTTPTPKSDDVVTTPGVDVIFTPIIEEVPAPTDAVTPKPETEEILVTPIIDVTLTPSP